MASKPDNLHSLAVTAEGALEQLATGLASAGAPEAVTKQVSNLASQTRRVISALGAGQEETGDNEPPAPEIIEPEPSEAAAPTVKRRTIRSAADELYAQTQAAAAARG